MLILAVDTASKSLSVALAKEKEVLNNLKNYKASQNRGR